jgi:hypothetical protein
VLSLPLPQATTTPSRHPSSRSTLCGSAKSVHSSSQAVESKAKTGSSVCRRPACPALPCQLALYRPCQVLCITDPLLYTFILITYPLNPHLTTTQFDPLSHSPSPSWLYPSRPLSWISSSPSLKLYFHPKVLFADQACLAPITGRHPSPENFQRVQSLLYTHTRTTFVLPVYARPSCDPLPPSPRRRQML